MHARTFNLVPSLLAASLTIAVSAMPAAAASSAANGPATKMQSQAAPATTPPERTRTPSDKGLSLTMEDQHVLKEILLKDTKIPHASLQQVPKAGDTVPASVKLQDFPDLIGSKVPKVKAHQFIIVGNSIVIVRPQGRRVADVVK
jgi:hypothetical protein